MSSLPTFTVILIIVLARGLTVPQDKYPVENNNIVKQAWTKEQVKVITRSRSVSLTFSRVTRGDRLTEVSMCSSVNGLEWSVCLPLSTGIIDLQLRACSGTDIFVLFKFEEQVASQKSVILQFSYGSSKGV